VYEALRVAKVMVYEGLRAGIGGLIDLARLRVESTRALATSV
jgi:hypothetical protein